MCGYRSSSLSRAGMDQLHHIHHAMNCREILCESSAADEVSMMMQRR